jgi:hypothetical protein
VIGLPSDADLDHALSAWRDREPKAATATAGRGSAAKTLARCTNAWCRRILPRGGTGECAKCSGGPAPRPRGRAVKPPQEGDAIVASDPALVPLGHRVLLIDPAWSPAETNARMVCALAERGPLATMCGRCDRRLCRDERGGTLMVDETRAHILAEVDWCRWCARPISERGEQQTPPDGFLRFVRAVAQRSTADPTPSREGAP